MAKPTNRGQSPSRASTAKAKASDAGTAKTDKEVTEAVKDAVETPEVDQTDDKGTSDLTPSPADETPELAETPDVPPPGKDDAEGVPVLDEAPIIPDEPEAKTDDALGSGDDSTIETADQPAAKSAADPEPAASAPAPAPLEQARIAKGPGFFTLLLGGVIAGGIGYALAEYDIFPSGDADALAQLETRISDQTARIETLAGQTAAAEEAAGAAEQTASATAEQLANLPEAATPDDIAALREEIANLPAPAPASPDGSGPDLQPRLSDLETRVDDLSAAIARLSEQDDAPTEALAALAERLDALDQRLEEQGAAIADAKSSADAARSSAADETRRITVQAALAQMSAALENGEPFVDAVSSLKTAGDVEVPAALADTAPEGVATLSALQTAFPPQARAALSVSIRENSGGGGALDRLGDFLKAQTGARSLDAREGDDPDAILSRAEAALKSGDLATALSEIETLPEVGQAELADWSARAQTRLDATTALADLTATLNSN
ncbi:COG4223 family protein [Oceaniglobus trochenteri]|uniref:COG4223 family protein n=1 Tax=Oceaniglobus trochenteri TaxID=2763260 RepID=UPI001CFF8980|nr:hypothetical protein [Oceaniglobus trochenteri]